MTNQIVAEEWRPVVGFAGWYSVSNLGSLRRDRPNRQSDSGSVTQHDNGRGYRRVALCVRGRVVQVSVHRLVALAFLGPAPKGHEVNHKNGIKCDNRADNLEWVTHQQNSRHSFNVLGNIARTCRGSRNGKAKLTEARVQSFACHIKWMRGEALKRMAKRWGVSRYSLYSIKYGHAWGHITGIASRRLGVRRRYRKQQLRRRLF
jgi:hypothetical protein